MSGNAMQEGLILQIHNPSHLDPSRFDFLAGVLSGFAALVLATMVMPDLPRLVAVYLQRFALYLRHCIALTGEAVVEKQPRSPVRVIHFKRKAL